MGTADRLKKEMEEALIHADRRKDELRLGLEEMRSDAARGLEYRRRIVIGAYAVGALIGAVLIFIMFREPQYRALFGFFLLCLALMGALHFFRKK
jgi:hypothetical protein